MSEAKEMDFWGNVVDPFVSMKEKYGIWPTTIWPIDLREESARVIKDLLNEGTTREGTLQVGYMGRKDKTLDMLKEQMGNDITAESLRPKSCYQNSVSIFNPSIATYILNCFAPETGRVFDPFAGGGTRAIMCAKRGLEYVGVELRQEEVEAVRERCERVNVSDKVTIIHGDSTKPVPIADYGPTFDFLITCPPYYDLEKYGGGENDLSGAASYDEFIERLEPCVQQCARLLKPGAKAVWVVGLHRNADGDLLPLNHDISLVHRKNGFTMQEEIILKHENNGSIQRIGQFEKGKKRLVRQHEYALVFQRK